MFKYLNSFFNKGDERTIKAKKNILIMFFLKGISIILSLVIVPITINYVTPFQYGIWLTISSLVSWLSFADIGLGNGLKNKFIESISVGKLELAKTYVSTTYAIILLIMGIVWAIACGLSFFINWSAVLNAPSNMIKDLTLTVIIVLTNFSFQFILRLMSTLINAIQKPALASLFDTLSQFLLVIVLLLLINYTKGSLVYLALAMGITNVIVLFIGNIWAYTSILKRYRPKIKYVNFAYAKDVTSLGIKFFFLQIISIICYQTNNIIITQYLGPTEVTVYNIAYKYMFIIAMVYTIILTPFWSAFTEANTKGDFTWMRRVASKLRIIFFCMIIIGFIMFILSPICFKFWIGDKVNVPLSITFLMLLYHAVNIWGTLHTQLLAGLGKIKLQLIFSSLCGILNIPVCLLLCKWYGLEGIIIGNIIIFSIFGTWFGYIQVNKLLTNKATGIWNE